MITPPEQDPSPPAPRPAPAAAFTLAHLSDLHLSPIAGLSLRTLNLKRGLGFVNWRRRRGAIHDPGVAAAIVADMQAHTPDHIAVTGDLTNLGLPQEHAQALIWLESLGLPDRVSVVPGNHDIYVKLRHDLGVGRWYPFMSSDAWGRAHTRSETVTPAGEATFPYARRLGPLALIGINSSVPTPLFVHTGRIGADQAARLGRLLDAAARDGLSRVVLIHHAPLPGQVAPRWALADADLMADTLARHGAELVLHGHAHREIIADLPTPPDPSPHPGQYRRNGCSVGVPSASAAIVHRDAPLARYHLYRIARTTRSLRIDLLVRGFAAPGSGVVEISHRTLLETTIPLAPVAAPA